MIINYVNKSIAQSFGMRLQGEEYGFSYEFNQNRNGEYGDKFIFSQLENNPLEPSKISVLDLGAGQGRNTIPLAQKGYTVFAVDASEIGLMQIQEKARAASLSDRIHIVNANLLDSALPIPQKVDFAVMPHISQHFALDELRQVFKNTARVLNEGGKFIFDALIRRGKPEHRIFEDGIDLTEKCGAASFKKDDINKIAEAEGFNLVSITNFNEGTVGRATYEANWRWGGKISLAEQLLGIKKRPVKLKWFTFLKR